MAHTRPNPRASPQQLQPEWSMKDQLINWKKKVFKETRIRQLASKQQQRDKLKGWDLENESRDLKLRLLGGNPFPSSSRTKVPKRPADRFWAKWIFCLSLLPSTDATGLLEQSTSVV